MYEQSPGEEHSTFAVMEMGTSVVEGDYCDDGSVYIFDAGDSHKTGSEETEQPLEENNTYDTTSGGHDTLDFVYHASGLGLREDAVGPQSLLLTRLPSRVWGYPDPVVSVSISAIASPSPGGQQRVEQSVGTVCQRGPARRQRCASSSLEVTTTSSGGRACVPVEESTGANDCSGTQPVPQRALAKAAPGSSGRKGSSSGKGGSTAWVQPALTTAMGVMCRKEKVHSLAQACGYVASASFLHPLFVPLSHSAQKSCASAPWLLVVICASC